jgi:hypothetical protein
MIATQKITPSRLCGYCKFLSLLTRLSPPGSISRQFAKEARFRWNYRLTATNPAGRHVIMFRIGVGYWPCLHAPFLQIAFGKHIFEFWYGLPSYLKDPLRARRRDFQ